MVRIQFFFVFISLLAVFTLRSIWLPSTEFVDNSVAMQNSTPTDKTLDDWKSAIINPESGGSSVAGKWLCDVHPQLQKLQFTPFPLHFLPARGSLPHASIFAETQPGKCDLLPNLQACQNIGLGMAEAPDRWLEEFINIVVPRSCNKTSSLPCHGVDVGSNLGLVSMRLLQAGVDQLIAIEPQSDLCCAGRASAAYNGYKDRSLFLCGGLNYQENASELAMSNTLWRIGGSYPVRESIVSRGLPVTVPIYPFGTVFTTITNDPEPQHFDFIKIDTDSIDCELLRTLIDYQREEKLTFDTATLEIWTGKSCDDNNLFSQLLYDLQQDGYDVYRTPAEVTRIFEGYDGFTKRIPPIPDRWPQLVERSVKMPSTTLIKMKKFSLEEWKALPKEWRGKYQLALTKVSLADLEDSAPQP